MTKTNEQKLFEACRDGNLEGVRQVLRVRGLKVGEIFDVYHKRTLKKRSALSIACWNGHFEAAKLLLDNINLNIAIKGSLLCDVYYWKENKQITKLLVNSMASDKALEEVTTNVVISGEFKSTLFIDLILGNRDQEMLEVVIEKVLQGAKKDNPNIKLKAWDTEAAAVIAYVKEKLLLNRSNINSQLKLINLDQAIQNAFTSCQKSEEKLLQQASTNSSDEAQLWNACCDGNVSKVQELLETVINVNWEDSENGSTPLSIACEKGHVGIVKLLLANERVDPFLTTSKGETPLFVASEKGHTQVVKLLLADFRIRANGDTYYKQGTTAANRVKPAGIAAEKGHQEIVEIFLAKEIELCCQRGRWNEFSEKEPAGQLEYLANGVPCNDALGAYTALGLPHGELIRNESPLEIKKGTEGVALINYATALENAKKKAELAEDEYQQFIALLAQAAKECERKIMTPLTSGLRSWGPPRTVTHAEGLARIYAIIAQAEKLAENENFSRAKTTNDLVDAGEAIDEYEPTLQILIDAVRDSSEHGRVGIFKTDASLRKHLSDLYDTHGELFGEGKAHSTEDKINCIIEKLESMKKEQPKLAVSVQKLN